MDFADKDKPGNRKWTDQGKPQYTKETTGTVSYTLKTLIRVLNKEYQYKPETVQGMK